MHNGFVSGRPEVPSCSAVTKTLETIMSGKNLRLTITLPHPGWTISNRCSKSEHAYLFRITPSCSSFINRKESRLSSFINRYYDLS